MSEVPLYRVTSLIRKRPPFRATLQGCLNHKKSPPA
jgi:hypothetical protein